ncbi:type II secretion system protein [Desulfuromonas versatilis]|uniref:Type II secretion system protein n=1 Tax=Desulfuromonas versatilis TaxID=2802975 RepID=A0ABN6E327_9BACT|nr:OmpA family protein [Desulfuromonas versatilis]BCR05561.1 type II secretion system protein [Desulfuromonas versatilis]
MKLLEHKALTALLLAVLLIAGCAGNRAFQEGEELARAGDYDGAVNRYMEAVTSDPERHEYRMQLQYARGQAALGHLRQGKLLMEQGDAAASAVHFQLAVSLDPGLEAAGQQLQLARNRMRASRLLETAEIYLGQQQLRQAESLVKRARSLDPQNPRGERLQGELAKQRRTVLDGIELDLQSTSPISLRFSKTPLQDVFRILTDLSGINFIFEEDVRPQPVSLLLEQANFAQALTLILEMSGLERKVLNPKTIFVFPRTPDKLKLYSDQLIQAFYLSNIDAKKAVVMLRTMLQLRRIYVHEELNALVIRAEPEVIKLAQRIIEAADRDDAEVVFDVELVEVSHGDDLRFGPTLQDYSVGLGFGNPNRGSILDNTVSPGGSTENLASGLGRLETFYSLPVATFEFAKTLTDSEILANPRIRVKNRGKAKVHVGTREPVITVTINGDNRTDNIQYVDVGVKLDVEPSIRLDGTILTKVALEVSSVSDREQTTSGSIALTITTTNAQTELTLSDGEQTILGGLIRDTLNKTKTTIPVIGKIPVLGDMLSGHSEDKQKREIMLSITPHVVKAMDLPREDVASIWSGTEDALRTGPSFGPFSASYEPEYDTGEVDAAPAMRPKGPFQLPAEPELPAGETPQGRAPAASPAGPSLAPAPAAEPANEGVAEAAGATRPAVSLALIGPDRGYVGRELAVVGRLAGGESFTAARVELAYDAQKLEFLRAEDARSGPGTALFTVTSAPGRVAIEQAPGPGGSPLGGAGNLFRAYFRPLLPGTASIEPDPAGFVAPGGQRIAVGATGMTLEVFALPAAKDERPQASSGSTGPGAAAPRIAPSVPSPGQPPLKPAPETVVKEVVSPPAPPEARPGPMPPRVGPLGTALGEPDAGEKTLPAQVPAASAPPTAPGEDLGEFSFNVFAQQTGIPPEFETKLEEIAALAKSHPASRVLIEGHTDNVGPEAVNLRISRQRALEVRRVLLERFGLDPARVEARGYGEQRPVDENSTQEGRHRNRRVVVRVLP